MRDTPKVQVAQLSSFRYAALQQLLGVALLGTLIEAEHRSSPALVHPSAGNAGEWVVEAPASGVQAGGDPMTFTGARSLLDALEHAHSTYGSVIYLSR